MGLGFGLLSTSVMAASKHDAKWLLNTQYLMIPFQSAHSLDNTAPYIKWDAYP